MSEKHDGQPEVEYAVGDVASGTVTDVDDDGWLWLDVEGLDAKGWNAGIAPDELVLAEGESAQDCYAIGETINGLFVWWVNHEARILGLSAKRNAPGYVEALQRRAVGDVVSATVTRVMPEGLWLDVDGLVGEVPPWELVLGDGESAQDRYTVGETINGLFVWWVNHEARILGLSAKRNAPGYLEALQQHKVGNVASAVVADFEGGGGLWLDVDGLVGEVPPWELDLGDGESAWDRYAVGQTLDGLFVWQVDDDHRRLRLSVKRNTPGYVEAFQYRMVGDVVSGTVTNVDDGGWLWLDVDGLIGEAPPWELDLGDGESARERYTVGETIKDLFVWQVDDDHRRLGLSVKRNTPGYLEALQQHKVGNVASAVVADFEGGGGLWLDVDGLVGEVPPWELDLGDGESAWDRYAVGQTLDGLFVWQIDHDDRRLRLSVKRNAPGYLEALQRHAVEKVVSATVTAFWSNGRGLWLDVDGVVGGVGPQELNLGDGESARERYTVGETIKNLFVCEVDDDDARDLALSVKRNAPGYLGALQRRTVGEIASGAITQVDDGLWLDVDGLVGSVAPDDLALGDGESAWDRYAVGQTIDGLFVWQIDHDDRALRLSVKRNVPGYLEALQRHAVEKVVSATVTAFWSNGRGLWLDVDGVVGGVGPQELNLGDGESARERYTVGETIKNLFVCEVDDDDARDLALSVKRNAPGYLGALQRRTVGEIASGAITQVDDGLWLDVDGLVGSVVPDELALGDGESARERYAVGETIDGLFVWQIDYDDRALRLSVKRNVPGYLEALDAIARGDELDGIVVWSSEGGVWLDTAGVVGWIPTRELALDDGESPQTRYTVGDRITARVWQIDHEARDIILSVRLLTADFAEGPIAPGAEISVTIRGTMPRGVRLPVRVLAADSSVSIPPHALSLSTGVPRSFSDGEEIRAVVVELDDEGRPTRLSHRRALDGWDLEVGRLSSGTLVPNAQVMPLAALSDTELRMGAAAVDLGPITGFISEGELDHDSGLALMTYSGNETYGVVIESVERGGRAVVSHDRFEERWRELAAGFQENEGVEGELRDFDGETALLDLGSGLLAQMPARELPDLDPPGKAGFDRIGERFPLRITAIDRDSQAIYVEHRDQWVESLIGEPESETLEFKEVLKGDPDADDAKEMTRQAMRTINAFLNTEGGRLIIGVHDRTREVTGLEGDPGLDAETIEKKIDQATQMLEANLANLEPRDLLNDDLDGLVTWDTPSVRGGTLLVITCKRGPDAGVNYVVKGKPEFWVREGSSKKQLGTPREIRDHLRTRQQRAAAAGDAASDD